MLTRRDTNQDWTNELKLHHKTCCNSAHTADRHDKHAVSEHTTRRIRAQQIRCIRAHHIPHSSKAQHGASEHTSCRIRAHQIFFRLIRKFQNKAKRDNASETYQWQGTIPFAHFRWLHSANFSWIERKTSNTTSRARDNSTSSSRWFLCISPEIDWNGWASRQTLHRECWTIPAPHFRDSIDLPNRNPSLNQKCTYLYEITTIILLKMLDLNRLSPANTGARETL